VDPNHFKGLLFESEGTALDFKGEQYLFENASDEVKSKLLKDILAFANAWRRTDAYILIGVREVAGGPAEIVGVDHHLEDASLQEFVNSKTNRRLHFSYRSLTIDTKQVAALHIPLQTRPFFLTKNYGRLRANAIYFRVGSSTGVANPDEIARMGQADIAAPEPELELQFIGSDGIQLTDGAVLTSRKIRTPEDGAIPDYRHNHGIPGFTNANYNRDLTAYVRAWAPFVRIRLALANGGRGTAPDPKAVISIGGSDPASILCGVPRWLPDPPEQTNPHFLSGERLPRPAINEPVTVTRSADGWRVQVDFGKVQPCQILTCGEPLLLGSTIDQELTLYSVIFDDKLSSPIEHRLLLRFTVEETVCRLHELERFREIVDGTEDLPPRGGPGE
jgi:hypothetical protein